MASFSATISRWAQRNDARMTAVFRDAAQTVVNEVRIPVGAGGNMPVVTGNLMRSLTVSMGEMPPVRPDAKVRYDRDSIGNITATIARATLGETIHLGFQANYAPYMEAYYGFVRLTAQRWKQIVRKSDADLKKRVEG